MPDAAVRFVIKDPGVIKYPDDGAGAKGIAADRGKDIRKGHENIGFSHTFVVGGEQAPGREFGGNSDFRTRKARRFSRKTLPSGGEARRMRR